MAYNNVYGYSSNGYLQYLDQNGKPLTGGTLSTFIAGTTTPIVTYKDFNGEQNPHKITLDENGGATVILRQDIVYKFVIRDRNGDIFKTIDNIVTAGTTTVVEGNDVTITGKEGEIAVEYFIDTKEYSIKLDNTILAKLDEKEVFFCRYNNTSYSEIRDAYSAKKLIVMYKSQYNLYEYFLLDARDPHAFRFKKVEKDRITFYTIDSENGWLESYQNYEVDAQIPIASESVLGGIKVGQNLSIDEDGTLNAQAGGGGTSDNDKVAVDNNATAGYLEDVLDSSSDAISLAKSGNKLYLEFNSEITSDPKISTLDESMINADSSNYGGFNEQNFEWGVGTHQCELYLHKRVADAQGLVNRVRFAISALGEGGQNTQGFRFLLLKKDLTLLGASDYFVMGENDTYVGQIHNESLSVPEVGMYEVKMFEESEGSLVINRNTEYYIQIMTAGISLACINKDINSNYTYDFIMRNNLNVQSQVPRNITQDDFASMHQATKTIYCYMGAAPVL